MTAASAFPPEMSEGRPAEPSMEDILASIRRIIADDQNHGGKPIGPANGARRPPEPERAVARARTPYDDVLDLARLVPAASRTSDEPAEAEPVHPEPSQAAVAQAEYAASAPGAIDADRHPEMEGAAPSSSLRARMPEPEAREAEPVDEREAFGHPVPALSADPEGDLMSAPLGESVMSAFETLAATVVLQNTPMLERMMRDLLRPMLKDWLDDNLPGLVERLVRAEIERVARGTRG